MLKVGRGLQLIGLSQRSTVVANLLEQGKLLDLVDGSRREVAFLHLLSQNLGYSAWKLSYRIGLENASQSVQISA